MNIMAMGKKITWKKGKQYYLPYNIEAVGKNIKWGREGDGKFEEEYKVVGNFVHPSTEWLILPSFFRIATRTHVVKIIPPGWRYRTLDRQECRQASRQFTKHPSSTYFTLVSSISGLWSFNSRVNSCLPASQGPDSTYRSILPTHIFWNKKVSLWSYCKMCFLTGFDINLVFVQYKVLKLHKKGEDLKFVLILQWHCTCRRRLNTLSYFPSSWQCNESGPNTR